LPRCYAPIGGFAERNDNSGNINRGYKTIKDLPINFQIKAPEVRLVGANSEPLGVMPTTRARQLAEEQGYDLVAISPMANPVVCKLMDYSKHKFEMQKREKEARKKSKIAEIKGMELSMRIEEHDMLFKAKHVSKFLQNGEKVRVIIKKVRGRLAAYAGQGIDTMNRFYEMVKEHGDIEQKPVLGGTVIVMVIAPKGSLSAKDKK